jgi:O-antigen ligase
MGQNGGADVKGVSGGCPLVKLASTYDPQTIQRTLKRLTNVALFAFIVCSVVSISAMQTAYILALVAWLIRLYLQGGNLLLRFPLLVPMCGFALASALATLTAVSPYQSLIELRNVFEATVFFLVVNHVTTEERAHTLTQVLIATGTLMALYGLTQSLAKGADFRIPGTINNYITFADLLMLIALIALAQLLFKDNRRWILWYVPALLLLTAALLMTHTRGAWLGLIAGCCVLLGLHKKRLLLALPLLVLAVLFLAPPAVKARLYSVFDLQNATAQERLYMWRSGLKIIRDHPWTGIGMGAMRQVYVWYRDPNDPRDPQKPLGHLHNNLIQIAAERGLIGLAFWLGIWAAYFCCTWSIYERLQPQQDRAKALVVGSLASVTAFHIAGLFEHNFGDSEVITLVYFLMALPFLTQRSALSTPTTGQGH